MGMNETKKHGNRLGYHAFIFIEVPRTRLELAHRNRHQPLKLACLPIPPSGHLNLEIAKLKKILKPQQYNLE